jgi:hypothetical protein
MTYILIFIGGLGIGYGLASRAWRKSYENLGKMIEKSLYYRETGIWKD